MKCTIYHNPKCSKCRTTLEILNSKGIEPTIIEYLKDPPSKDELEEIVSKLKIHPRQLVRFKEDKAKELGISADDELTREQWLSIMADNPVLIERPIVITPKGAVIGRPPENVLEVLE
ncbi:MAG: Arsenate reductase [Deltaproteobacteria bacterium]|jgi:arsenate reductase|nr:Arsenate reductase [Deltaproteobacteria bacterium]